MVKRGHYSVGAQGSASYSDLRKGSLEKEAF